MLWHLPNAIVFAAWFFIEAVLKSLFLRQLLNKHELNRFLPVIIIHILCRILLTSSQPQGCINNMAKDSYWAVIIADIKIKASFSG